MLTQSLLQNVRFLICSQILLKLSRHSFHWAADPPESCPCRVTHSRGGWQRAHFKGLWTTDRILVPKFHFTPAEIFRKRAWFCQFSCFIKMSSLCQGCWKTEMNNNKWLLPSPCPHWCTEGCGCRRCILNTYMCMFWKRMQNVSHFSGIKFIAIPFFFLLFSMPRPPTICVFSASFILFKQCTPTNG